MALVIRSVQPLGSQVSKIIIEGKPLSGDLSVKEILAYYEKLGQDKPVPAPAS